MSDDEQQESQKRTKPKRVVSQATLDMLAAGRAKRDANRKAVAAEKVTQNGQELVLVDREKVRQDRESRSSGSIGASDKDREAGPTSTGEDREAGRHGGDDRESREEAEREDRESREDEDPESRPRDDGQDRESRERHPTEPDRESRGATRKPRSIDDVVNKLRTRDGEDPLESEYPSVEEVARRTETYGAGAAVPPTERDPAKRDKPTMGRVDLTNDAAPPDLSTSKVRGLADLMAMFPVGDGQYEIQVVRKAPVSWGGFQCKGQQRPIREYMTDADFVDGYGGGDYLLTVFGPPRRGGIVDPRTRRIRPKALTDPVPYSVPQTYPPNPEACVFEDHDPDDEDEDTDMRYSAGYEPRTSRPNTNADAKILEVQTSADERKEERRREREREIAEGARNTEREMAERLAAAQREQIPLVNGALTAVREANDRAHDLAKAQIDAAEARADRERDAAEKRMREHSRPDPAAELAANTMNRMVEMLTQRSPEQGAELARLAGQYASERENMQAAHQRELERVQTHSHQALRDAEERATSRVRDVETRADLRVKAAEDQAVREVSAARDAASRDKADLERMLLARITDEQRNHERELRAKDEAFTSRSEVQKTAFEMRLAQKDDEIRRLGGDAERFRVEAEKNRDLPARMQEFAVAAEAMGFAKDGGAPEPASWKELAGQVGLQLVAKLPEIVQSAGEAVRGAKPQDMSQQAQYAQMQQEAQNTHARRMVPPLPTRSGAPFGQQRMIFGTEDGPAFHGGDVTNPEGSYVPPRDPGPPNNEPMMAPAGLQPLAPAPMVNAGSPPQYVYPPEVPQQQAPTWQMPPQQQAPVQAQQQPAQQSPAAQPQAAPAAGGDAVTPQQIMQIAPVVEQAFAAKEPPENLAAGIIAQVGKPMAAAIAKALSVERVVATVQQHNPASALIRRDGQKYLKAVWAQVKAQSAA